MLHTHLVIIVLFVVVVHQGCAKFTSNLLQKVPPRNCQSNHLCYQPTPLSNNKLDQLLKMKGGEVSANPSEKKVPVVSSWKRNLLGLWGVVQVVSILGNAIKRLVPVVLQPFQQNNLTPAHWGMYAVFCAIMAYSEGYKAFHLKFSPQVVSRSFDLVNNPSILNYLLAGPYSMGMFNAPRKRMIVSWGITIGVFALVKVVKFLPYPYRSIVDAGAVVGLGLGTLSIVYLTIKALFGGKVEVPEEKKAA